MKQGSLTVQSSGSDIHRHPWRANNSLNQTRPRLLLSGSQMQVALIHYVARIRARRLAQKGYPVSTEKKEDMKEEVAWWNLTPTERTVYLRENQRRLAQLDATQGPENDPPGSVYHLDSTHITDFSSFLCALGEAINGPGGYFGSSMRALDDCAVGGFGATPPFTLKVHQPDLCYEYLDSHTLAAWCEEQIARRDPEDGEEGLAWLQTTLGDARKRQANLFDELIHLLERRRITVELAGD